MSLSTRGYLGQHPSQPGPVVERPGQGLGLAEQGEAPPILSQWLQRGCHSEADLDGQPPGVAVLGQVREGLEGLLEGGHRLAERGTVEGPGTGLLAVRDGLVPHLAPQGMVRQAFDLVRACLPAGRAFAPEATSATRSSASASIASTMQAWSTRRRSSRRLP